MGSTRGSSRRDLIPLLRPLGGALIAGLFALPDPVLRRLAGSPPESAAGLEPDAWLVARLSEIARRLGLSRERVRQFEQRAMLKLRKAS